MPPARRIALPEAAASDRDGLRHASFQGLRITHADRVIDTSTGLTPRTGRSWMPWRT